MKSFVLHDESLNTAGYRMLTSGANLEELRKNPVMFYHHKDEDLPIGRWDNIRIEGTRILADAVFDLGDPFAAEIARKVEDDFIRMASIGAWPPEEKSSDPKLMLPGQTLATVTRWTAREASICPIGANHNAIVYDRTTGKQIELSDIVKLIDSLPSKQIDSKQLKSVKMGKELLSILNLADGASQEAVTSSVADLVAKKEEFEAKIAEMTAEIEKLKSEIAAAEKEKSDTQKLEAVTLVDRAVKAGKITAKSKDIYLSLFDSDFKTAKAAIDAIPERLSIVDQINASKYAKVENGVELADKSFDELDKSGQLGELKRLHPEMYKEKYKKRFGVDSNI